MSAPGRLAAFAALALLGSAAPGQAAPPRPRSGVFLYASPRLTDPNFVESVVLVLQHGPEGSLGVVINRPTRFPLREVLKDLAEMRGLELRLYEGGPVQPDAALALLRSAKRLGSAERVLADVQLSKEPKHWRAIAAGGEAEARLRVYAGYAGWVPGQLDQEMRRGSWVVGPADAASVFASDPSTLWPRVHDLMRAVEARAAPVP